MMNALALKPSRGHSGMIPEALLAVLLISLSVGAALATAHLGVTALALPLLAGSVILALASPSKFGVFLLGAAVALEPGAIDFSGDIAVLLYELPAGMELPLTISPLEISIVVAFLSALARRKPGEGVSVPLVALAVPAAMLAGFLHGWRSGGDMNIGYNEARGLIYGTAAFGLAVLSPRPTVQLLRRCLVLSTALLGAIVVYRYFAYVRTDNFDVPLEFAFAHEDSILLGVGFAYGLTWLARPSLSLRDRALLVGYVLLMLVALAATQRRAATLVSLAGAGTVGGLLLTRRPVLLVVTATPLLLLFGVFLASTWDREYGVTAQPARAIRSQIDPAPRDESSDLYRDIERRNVIETVRLNRILGVGFGRPFAQFEALPNLESFWPLQSYTPHQNVLWLWLKMGLAGLAAFLAVVALALSRALRVVRSTSMVRPEAALAIVTAATLLMYLAFATVDLALIGTRGSIPLAVALAVAFALPRPEQAEAKEGP